MVKVSIGVCSVGTRFDVAVQAESIERAVGFLKERFPGCDGRVKFPIDPGGFFVKDPAVQRGIVGFDRSDGMAA